MTDATDHQAKVANVLTVFRTILSLAADQWANCPGGSCFKGSDALLSDAEFKALEPNTLGLVELVMEVERAFNIEILDDIFINVDNLGELAEVVAKNIVHLRPKRHLHLVQQGDRA